jgi:hypothetical protein
LIPCASDWPEAFHLIRHKARLGYPRGAFGLSLPIRAAALVAAVKAVLSEFTRPS